MADLEMVFPPSYIAANKGPKILALCWTFTALGMLFTGARIFVRTIVHRRLFSEDYWILLSIVCSILSSILLTLSVQWGNGRHIAVLTTEQQFHVVLYMMSAYVPNIMSLAFPKLAVIALLTRLLNPGRAQRLALWGLGTTVVLVLGATVMLLMLECSPPRALWDHSVPGRKCLDMHIIEAMSFTAGSTSAFADFYLAIYPATVLWGLQMPRYKKIILGSVLGLGLVCGAIGIKKTTLAPTLLSSDVSWEQEVMYWTSIEGNIIIIASCVPILQPLVELCRGRSLSTLRPSIKSNEMNGGAGAAPAPLDQEPRRRVRKQLDTFGFTVQGKEDQSEFRSAITSGGSATVVADDEDYSGHKKMGSTSTSSAEKSGPDDRSRSDSSDDGHGADGNAKSGHVRVTYD